MQTKGIILAGGSGSRLYPITSVYSKQLVAVYDKPMLYYSLDTLISAGINDILIISNEHTLPFYKKLFSNTHLLGIKIQYAIQNNPNGIAEALLIGEEFIGKDNLCLILGDNIFYGNIFDNKANTIFGLYVKEPQRYGVISLDKDNNPIEIIEKPNKYVSNYAVPGIYFYDCDAINIAKTLKPSPRGELEITDLNNLLLKNNKLNVKILKNTTWFDCGTPKSLLDAANFIYSIEERHEIKVGCYEITAYRNNFCSKIQFIEYINTLPPCTYKDYLNNFMILQSSIFL